MNKTTKLQKTLLSMALTLTLIATNGLSLGMTRSVTASAATAMATVAAAKTVNVPDVLVPGQRYTVNTVEEYKAYVAKAVKNCDANLLLTTTLTSLSTNAEYYANQAVQVDYQGINDCYFTASGSRITRGSSIDVDLTFIYVAERSRMIEINAATDAKAAEIIATIIKPNMKDYEKEMAIHDYIINHADYDSAAAKYYGDHKAEMDKGVMPPIEVAAAYIPYGVLNLGKGVCESYARAAAKLLNMAGVKTLIMSGTAGGGHMWNIVYIGGEPYHLDLTFDDPIVSDGSKRLLHTYFNKTDNDMLAQGRSWDGSLAKCVSIKYTYENVCSLMNFVPDEEIPVLQKDSDFKVKALNNNQVEISGFSGDAQNITIPETLGGKAVVSIGTDAFADNKKLKTLVFNKQPGFKIGKSAFSGCSNLSISELPANIVSLGNNAFEACTSIRSMTFSTSITYIPQWCFSGCYNMRQVILSSAIYSIDEHAFEGTGLDSLVLPSSLRELGCFAFNSINNLKDVYFKGNSPKLAVYNFFGDPINIMKGDYPQLKFHKYADAIGFELNSDSYWSYAKNRFITDSGKVGDDQAPKAVTLGNDRSLDVVYNQSDAKEVIRRDYIDLNVDPSIASTIKGSDFSIRETATPLGNTFTYKMEYKIDASVPGRTALMVTAPNIDWSGFNTFLWYKEQLVGHIVVNKTIDKTNKSKDVAPVLSKQTAQTTDTKAQPTPTSAPGVSPANSQPTPTTTTTTKPTTTTTTKPTTTPTTKPTPTPTPTPTLAPYVYPVAPANTTITRIEAEKGVIQGGAAISSLSAFAPASNSKIVAYYNKAGASTTFKNMNQGIGVNIGYACGASNDLMDNKYGYNLIALYVNDIKIQEVKFPSTHGAGKKAEHYKVTFVACDIPKGATIKLQRDNTTHNTNVNIDYIELIAK